MPLACCAAGNPWSSGRRLRSNRIISWPTRHPTVAAGAATADNPGMNDPASGNQESPAPAGEPFHLPKGASCLKCGYLLQGLAEPRCPECGRMFDPADPRTYGRLRDPWWKRYAGRPSWARSALICAGCLWFAEAATRPGGIIEYPNDDRIILQVIVLLLWPVLVADYAIIAAATHVKNRYTRQDADPKRARIWPWVPIPLALSLGFLAGMTDLVNTWRFEISRPALERAAIDTLRNRPPQTPCWIGLYRVERVAERDLCVAFKTGTTRHAAGPVGLYCEWPRSAPWNALSQVKPAWSVLDW